MPRVKQAPKQRKKATAASGKAAKNNGSAAPARPAAVLPPDSMTTMTTVVANGNTGHPVPAAQPPAAAAPETSSPDSAPETSSPDSSPSASGTQTPVHPKKRRGEAIKEHQAKAIGVAATGKGAGKVTKTKRRMMSTLAKANALKKTAAAAAANGASEAPSAKKKRRWRQGTVALREIRRQQKSVDLIIPDAPFMRLVREVISEGALAPASPQKITREAYIALKEGAESYLIDLFRDVQTSALSHQRTEIFPRDLWLALRLRGELHKYPGVRNDTANPEAAAIVAAVAAARAAKANS